MIQLRDISALLDLDHEVMYATFIVICTRLQHTRYHNISYRYGVSPWYVRSAKYECPGKVRSHAAWVSTAIAIVLSGFVPLNREYI